MTYQRDPDTVRRRTYLRRDDGSWSLAPILIGIAVLALLAYTFLGMPRDGSRNVNRADAPATQTNPSSPTTPNNK